MRAMNQNRKNKLVIKSKFSKTDLCKQCSSIVSTHEMIFTVTLCLVREALTSSEECNRRGT